MALATSREDSAALGAPLPASAEFRRLQIIIGLDDRHEPILGRAIAAVGVGMVPLHQLLEACLDLGGFGINLQAQRIERLALGVAHLPRLLRGLLPRGATASAAEL